MKLYERDAEIKLLQRQLWLSREQRSRMTVLTGRHGSGKTSLVAQAFAGEPFLYFRLGGKMESLLLKDYIGQVRQRLDLYVPAQVLTFDLLLSFIFDSAYKRPITLVIDHFDEWSVRHPDFPAYVRELWDNNRRGSHLNLVLISENSAVTSRLFDEEDAPLVNADDCRITLDYYSPGQLKRLLLAHNAERTSEDLLALYMTTGGMPMLVAAVLAATDGSKEQIYRYLLHRGSPLHTQARAVLDKALGKNSEVYLSILQLIATGVNTQSDIEDQLGGIIVGGHLAKLETEYELITKMRPVLAGKASRNVVRFRITDMFLSFWLKYIEANRAMVNLDGSDQVVAWALADFETAGQRALTQYLMRKFSSENGLSEIGGDWAPVKPSHSFARRRDYYLQRRRGEQPVATGPVSHAIAIIALDHKRKKALVADVCLHAESFQKTPFLDRLAELKKGPLKGYVIDSRVFTLEDM